MMTANTAMWLCGDIVRSIKGEIVLYSGVGWPDRYNNQSAAEGFV